MYHRFFTHSSVSAYLGCFYVLAIVNSATMNTGVHVSFRIVVFSRCMSSSEVARPYGRFILSFVRKLHTVLHNGCISLRFHQQCRRVPFPPYPLQHLLFVDFLMMGIHTVVKWHLTIILICISPIISNVEHHFMFLLAICMILEKCLFTSSTHFITELFVFLILSCMTCYIFWGLILCELFHLQLFSSIQRVTFHLAYCFLYCCCSITELCPSPCNPMNCSTLGFPVLHHLLVMLKLMFIKRWCHAIILSSVVLFSSNLHPFPASRSFLMSQLFASGGQSIGVSSSATGLPMTIQDWFLLRWTAWISLQSKGLSRVFSNTTVQKHQFFRAQLSF